MKALEVAVHLNSDITGERIAEIDPDVIDKDDPEIMEDLIAAAVNKALDQAEVLGREELEKATKGIMPNIPGLDLGKLGFGA